MMNRRSFVAGALALPLFRLLTPAANKTYGYLNCEMALARGFMPARVLLNGQDVSSEAIECDDESGYIVRFVKPYAFDRGNLKRECINGHVQFFPTQSRKA